MRFLFVSLNYAPEPTATGRYTGDMAEWLASQDHEVDVIAGLPHYPQWQVDPAFRRLLPYRRELNGVNVMRSPHFVPRPERVTGLGRILMELTYSFSTLLWWIRILVARRRYDAVIVICPPIKDALMAWIYRLVRGVPYIVHVQDFQVDAAIRLGVLRIGVFGRLLYGFENFLLRRASGVSTITEAMLRRAGEKGVDRNRVWLVPNWADPAIAPRPRDNAFREELQFHSSTFVCIYAGAVAKKQGLDCLLDAADRLRHDSTIRIVIVGAGSDYERLRRRARELDLPNLKLLPVQPEERLPDLLAAADIHLAIQRGDAADLVMPSKLTNIMAAGQATIATADQGTAIWDVLEGLGAGKCVPADDAESLADVIQQLARDPETVERMGQKARAYAETHLEKDSILRGFETKFSELVGASPAKKTGLEAGG